MELMSVRATRSAGMNADNGAREQHDAQRKEEDVNVWIEIKFYREVGAEIERAEKSGGPPAEQQSRAAAEECEQEAFGEILANQPYAAGADRGANGHFALAHRCAHQEHVRDVETRDEQHEGAEGGERQRDVWNRVVGIGLGAREFFRESLDGNAFVGVGMLFGDAVCDDAERCARLLQVDARVQPCEKGNAATVAAFEELLHVVLALAAHGPYGGAHRHECIHAEEGVSAKKPLWRNTDNGHGAIIDLQSLADDAGIAIESLLPVGVAQNDDRIGVQRFALVRPNQAAERGLNSERGEIVAAYAADDAMIAAVVGEDAHQGRAIGEDFGGGGGLRTNVEEIRVREGLEAVGSLLLLGEHGDLLGMRDGE